MAQGCSAGRSPGLASSRIGYLLRNVMRYANTRKGKERKVKLRKMARFDSVTPHKNQEENLLK